MGLVLVVLNSDCVSADDDVVVVGEFAEFCVLGSDFDVETSRVLDGKGLEIDFTHNVDVFVVNFAHCDRQNLLLDLAH
jgi:hypothetical protein